MCTFHCLSQKCLWSSANSSQPYSYWSVALYRWLLIHWVIWNDEKFNLFSMRLSFLWRNTWNWLGQKKEQNIKYSAVWLIYYYFTCWQSFSQFLVKICRVYCILDSCQTNYEILLASYYHRAWCHDARWWWQWICIFYDRDQQNSQNRPVSTATYSLY